MQRLRRLFVLSHEWNVFLILLIILSISLASWWTVKVHLEKEWNSRLEAETEKVVSHINLDLAGFDQALGGVKAHLETAGIPTVKGFEDYVKSLSLTQRFPGLQGIAFAERVDFKKIPELEKRLRLQGFSDFKIWPAGERELYTAITMIQPDEWRNQKVLGFDMYSEPIRKHAMDKALITQKPAITDPLALMQDESVGTLGALVYLPVTKIIATDKNLEPKNELLGFVYVIMRVGRFFTGSTGEPDFYKEKVNYRVEAFDPRLGKETVIYERFPSQSQQRFGGRMTQVRDIEVFDKTWRVTLEPLPHFYNSIERYIPLLFAFVTLVMLSVIFLALWSTQQFLKFSERHKDSLALLSKKKSEEILLTRKLNAVVADMSSAVDAAELFEKLYSHLDQIFEIDDCVVFVREPSGVYEKIFQKIDGVFPNLIEVPKEFDSVLKEGVYDTTSSGAEIAKILSFLPVDIRRTVTAQPYYFMRCSLHEAGKTNSAFVLMRAVNGGISPGSMQEYVIVSMVGHFATSYDKAVLLRRAEDANVMKSSFLANMSHEIRTPLGVIVGYSEILGDDDLRPEEKEQIVKSVKRNGKELARLIDDILDISKVEAGKLHFEMAQVQLENLIHEIKSIMEVRASDRRIQFNIAKLGNVPRSVITDDVRLKQILINVVGNAIKFTEAGGVKLLYGVFSNESHEEFLEFQIQDSGIGIDERSRQNLFKPFSQGDVSTTRKFGGTGLGLALSKRLAELLGGDLFLLESSVGKGSTFCLRIPLRVGREDNLKMGTEGPVANSIDESPDRAIDWSKLDLKSLLVGCRILLVEDSEDNQDIFQHFLSSAGAHVVVVDDGEKAIAQAVHEDPDIILMDIQIPKIDGKEATRKIRKIGFKKPIIALTAHALNEEIESCIAAGCNGQITKPVSGELLIQEVYFYLNHRS